MGKRELWRHAPPKTRILKGGGLWSTVPHVSKETMMQRKGNEKANGNKE